MYLKEQGKRFKANARGAPRVDELDALGADAQGDLGEDMRGALRDDERGAPRANARDAPWPW